MKKQVAVNESRSKLKEFFKKLSWWKKIIFIVLIVVAIVIVWKIVHKPYYIKEDLCHSNFLEDCEGKKVEVTGTIVKGQFCPKFETETYILCDTNILPCDTAKYESRDINEYYDCAYGAYPLYKGRYDNCLSLVQPCWGIDANKKINDYVENLLPNPANKKVKIVGDIFITRTSPFVSVDGKVGITPESITITGDES
ncbi:MAG: hypothetical protein Q8O03_00910 [Nanoarchaeota archaeon]|nr:hypothetical protein [Nanoarchaeota archaeon]